MHFEILVEDQSGKKSLDILMPKILDSNHTFRIHPYKGIGKIPTNMNPKVDPSNRILLDQLSRFLRGYGKTFANYPKNYKAALILVFDLDDKCLKEFRQELFVILDACNPKPETRFCIAIEEGEAWFLGDIPAIKAAYPNAKYNILDHYQNDSICGTWEVLADAIVSGGIQALVKKGWQAVGIEKSTWAECITPHMQINNNASPSFNYFVSKIRELAQKI